MIKFILGNFNKQKTNYCLEEITNKSENNIIYLVPEQYTMQAEKKLCTLQKGNALLNVNIMSFNRLVDLSHSKINNIDNKLSNVDKIIILRKLLFNNVNKMQFFKESTLKDGFVELLLNTFDELSDYKIDINKMAETELPNQSLNLKIKDLQLIYNQYNNFISDKFITNQMLMEKLSNSITTLVQPDTKIYIDKFYYFTPLEFSILQKLSENFDLTFCLTVDKLEKTYQILDNDLYNQPKALYNKLQEHGESETLKYFSENEFQSLLNENKCFITSASNEQQEIIEVAKQILHLTKKGYRYKDISVLVNNLSNYRNIKNIFDLFDIPVFFDEKEILMQNSFASFILGIFELILSNWSYEAVFNILKSPFFPIEKEKIDILENYVLANGIKGFLWSYDWKYKNDNLDEILLIKQEIFNLLERFYKLSSKSKVNVREFCTHIFDFLIEIEVDKSLQQIIDVTENKAQKRTLEQIWQLIGNVFNSLVEIYGADTVTISEIYELIKCSFKNTQISVIPPNVDQIIVNQADRSKIDTTKVLFVLGVNDSQFPQIATADAFFSDEDRDQLLNSNFELAPTSRKTNRNILFNVYELLSTASDYIFFSYLDYDKMSIFLADLCAEYNIKPKSRINEKSYKNELQNLGLLLHNEKMNSTLSYFYHYKQNDIQDLLDSYKYFYSRDDISKESAIMLQNSNFNTSISRLENFANCPFSYFLQYNMKIFERKVFEYSSMDTGSLLHEILENFFNSVINEKLQLPTLTPETIDEISNTIIEDTLSQNDFLNSSSRAKLMSHKLSNISKKSIWAIVQQQLKSDFNFSYLEYDFFDNDILKFDDFAFNFRGKIDRVDIFSTDDTNYVKIIDYKSGSKTFSRENINLGVQIQMVLYMQALLNSQSIQNAKPAGLYYFSVQNPIMSADDKSATTKLLKEFKLSGLTIDDETVINALDNNFTGHSEIIPVQRTKEGLKSLNLYTEDEFDELCSQIKQTIYTFGQQMQAGKIHANPVKVKKHNACRFCIYSSVCNNSDKFNCKRIK